MARSLPDERELDEEVAGRIARELEASADVLAALWVGSRERGEGIGPSSDIDILAITRESAGEKWRRGYRDVPSGRFIELLYRPASLDRARFALAVQSGDAWLHGYVHGRALFDKDGTLASLMSEARTLWENGPAPLSASDREWERYELWMDRADIADRVASSPHVAGYLIGVVGQRLFRYAYRLERWWWPPAKYVLVDLESRDVGLADLFVRVFGSASPAVRLAALDATFDLLAGRFGIDFGSEYRTVRGPL